MTDFKTELARLMEGAHNGVEGAAMDLRDLLEENAAAILALVEAAEGLSQGVDWNNGTHAKTHGYRRKLLKAVAQLTGNTKDPT